jgi:MFS transporter, DHA2 family, multidrug resistance protein
VIYGIKQIFRDGLGFESALLIMAGVAVGAVFLRRQKKPANPLIDLHLFKIPAFSASLASSLLGFFVNFGVFFFISQYLQLVLGQSPLQAGLWMLPWPLSLWSLSFVAGSTLTPVIVRRVPPGL